MYFHHLNNSKNSMSVVARGHVFQLWHVSLFLWEHDWAFVILSLPLSISSVRALFRLFPHAVCQSEGWTRFSLERMLKGVCMRACLLLCHFWEVSPTHHRFGRWEPFYGHFMLREGLFIAAGYCFFKVWLLLLEKSIERAEWGWLYQALLCDHRRGSSAQSS